MGDVQLPLRLSTCYYIGVSTSNPGEDTSPASNATLFTFTKPAFRFFRVRNFTKNQKSHGTKDGNPKKVMVSLHWPFFSVVKSQVLEISSPSLSKDTLSSSSSSSVNNEGDGIESFACQKSPLGKSSPVSSISPSSVLSKKLFIKKEAESNENGGRKITWDSFESFISDNDAPKLSSLMEGKKEMEWGTSKSFARYDHQLSRSTPCNVVEVGGANFVKDINDDGDGLIALDLYKSDSSPVYDDHPLTSLRKSSGGDILKIEAGNMMENSSEISDEEIQLDNLGSFDGNDAKSGKATEVAPNLPESKKTVTCKGDNPFFVVKLFERFSVFSPFGGKMLRAIGSSHSTMLWMNLKKRIVLLAAWQTNLKVKHVVKKRISGGEVELWKKNIPMGRRCRVLELEDCSCRNGEGQLMDVAVKNAADVRMNSDGDEVMAEGLSLHELMEMAAEAPVFNWNSK